MNNTTTIEAINKMLATIGEAPIQTLEGDQTSDVAIAVTILNDTTRFVQNLGWGWNTDYDYSFARNGSNFHVPIPKNVSHLEFKKVSTIDPVRRGGFVYDRKNKRFEFDAAVVADRVVWTFEFEELPQAARDYVAIKAAREFTQKVMPQSEVLQQLMIDEAAAFAKLRKDENRSEDRRFSVDNRITGRNG